MRGPVQRRSKDSTVRMLDAALALASEGGLDAVTIAAVADRSGTSNGSLYHRFDSRSSLLTALIDRFLSDIEDEYDGVLANATAEPDDGRALVIVIDAHVRIFARERALFRAFMIDGRDDPGMKLRGYAASRTLSAAIIGWVQQRFDCTTRCADTAFRILFGLGASRVLTEDDDLTAQPPSHSELIGSIRNVLLGYLRNC